MFDNIMNFFKNWNKKENKALSNSKDAAKERLHLVLMQDRANVSADFLELMKQEIIEVIKKYIDVDESAIDVRLTNKENSDGTNGAPALYANIPILNIKNEARKVDVKKEEKNTKKEEIKKAENSEVKEAVEEAEGIIEEVQSSSSEGKAKEKKAKKEKKTTNSEKTTKIEDDKEVTKQDEKTEVKKEVKSENK